MGIDNLYSAYPDLAGKTLDWYLILSPVLKPWFWIVIVLFVVLIPAELNITGFNNILPVKESLETLICVDVPIPTDKLLSNKSDISSSSFISWDSVVVTIVLILSTLPVTSSRSVSNLYKSLSVFVIFLKY